MDGGVPARTAVPALPFGLTFTCKSSSHYLVTGYAEDARVLAAALRAWPAREGLARREVAQILGVCPCTLRYWETGRVRPKAQSLRTLVERPSQKGLPGAPGPSTFLDA